MSLTVSTSDGFIANWENTFDASESYDVSYSVVQTSSVTVSGIDFMVSYTMNQADVDKLAGAFKVTDITSTGVQDATLRRNNAGEANLKTLISSALENAVDNTTTIQNWLKSTYLDAFFNDVSDTTFANYFENVNIDHTPLSIGYADGASSLWNNLDVKTEELDDLLMQMPESNFPNKSVTDLAPELSYLPLKKNDAVIFLFRVTVSAEIKRANDSNVDISTGVGGTAADRSRTERVVANRLRETPLIALKLVCDANATE